LDFVLSKCSKNETEKANFKNNLAYVGIFTKANFEKNNTEIFDGISLFIANGNTMQHHFFEKKGNEYIENEKLSYKTKHITKKDISFVIFYTKLNRKGSISYYLSEFSLAKNIQNRNEDDYVDMDFLEFQTATFAENTELSNRPSNNEITEIEIAAIAPGYCYGCNSGVVRGSCTSSNNCNMYSGGGSCSASIISDGGLPTEYSSLVNKNIMYEIRDNLLGNSIIGEKYYAFYYYSSLGEITTQLSISEQIQIATTLPIIYDVYDKIKNSKYDKIVFTESEKNQLINVLNIYRTKNISDNFAIIIDSVIKDINALSGKTIGYLNQIIY
jgi:hypothetical protein